MIANEDSKLIDWLLNCQSWDGGFLNRIATAAMSADSDNYGLLRTALLQLKAKYPAYDCKYSPLERPKGA